MPIWLEGSHPTTYISVGSPPQQVSVILDTGSGFTWIQGVKEDPDSSSPQRPSGFNTDQSQSWRSLNSTTEMIYLDPRIYDIQNGYEVVSVGESMFEIPIGVGRGSDCESFIHGILGLDISSDFLQAFSKSPGNKLSIISFAFAEPGNIEGKN
jgi:hypothetical protein